MGIFKSMLGCISESAHFEDVARAVYFYYFHFHGRFPELNEQQLRCMALLYGAFYDQKHHIAMYHVKYCIVHWVCGDRMINDLDELVLTFVEGVTRNYYPETARKALNETDYKIKLGKVLAEKEAARIDNENGGGGILKSGCRNVTLDRLAYLCADLGRIVQSGTMWC